MLLRTLIPNISTLIPYDYSHIRSPQSETLLNLALKNIPSVPHPKLIHMFGIPGAGKSTFYHTHTWSPHVFIDFDHIMKQLPQYQQDLFLLGSVEAFDKWEIPARVIGYELLRRAVGLRQNIFFDHGGANTAHLNLIKNLRLLGYSTEMHYVYCSTEQALLRAKQREQQTGRHTPPQIIYERASAVTELAEKYKKIADAFYAYDNSSNQFIPQKAIL